jgi:hypothetical protein
MGLRARSLSLIRALLALAILWTAMPGSVVASGARAEIVAVAESSDARAPRGGASRPCAVARKATPRALPSAANRLAWRLAQARRAPALRSEAHVLIEDLYLRHLAILC